MDRQRQTGNIYTELQLITMTSTIINNYTIIKKHCNNNAIISTNKNSSDKLHTVYRTITFASMMSCLARWTLYFSASWLNVGAKCLQWPHLTAMMNNMMRQCLQLNEVPQTFIDLMMRKVITKSSANLAWNIHCTNHRMSVEYEISLIWTHVIQA